jgi:hypothetical protein
MMPHVLRAASLALFVAGTAVASANAAVVFFDDTYAFHLDRTPQSDLHSSHTYSSSDMGGDRDVIDRPARVQESANLLDKMMRPSRKTRHGQ